MGALGGAPASDAGPPNPAAMGVGAGAPPSFTNAPPKPTGVGQIPTGSPGTTKIAAISDAVRALREAGGYLPNLQGQIDALIESLKAGLKSPPSGSPGGPAVPGEPSPLGTPPPMPDAVPQSGTSPL